MASKQQYHALIERLRELNTAGDLSPAHLADYARHAAVEEILQNWAMAFRDDYTPSDVIHDLNDVIRSLEEFRNAARQLVAGIEGPAEDNSLPFPAPQNLDVAAEHHPASGGGQVTIDLARFPHLAESTTGLWPFDQQTQFAAAVSQLSRALPRWMPDLKDTVLKERLARGFAYQALYGIRRKMNNHGHIPDADIIDEIQRMEQTQGRHPT